MFLIYLNLTHLIHLLCKAIYNIYKHVAHVVNEDEYNGYIIYQT